MVLALVNGQIGMSVHQVAMLGYIQLKSIGTGGTLRFFFYCECHNYAVYVYCECHNYAVDVTTLFQTVIRL